MCVAGGSDKCLANAMHNNAHGSSDLQLLLFHRKSMCVCVPERARAAPLCMSDVATWHRNTTQHSYLAAHISSMLEDTDRQAQAHTHTHTHTVKVLSASEPVEGVGMDRMKVGCMFGLEAGRHRVKE